MSKVMVKNETLRIISLPGEDGKRYSLKPGTQYVELENWKQIRSAAKYHIDLENLSLPEEGSDDDLAEGLAGYKAKDAVDLVKATTDEAVLADWLAVEKGLEKPRATVVKAIEAQFEELKNALTGKKDDDKKDDF